MTSPAFTNASSSSADSGAAGESQYPTMLSPLEVGGKTFRNRVIMGSMHTGLEDKLEDAPKLAEFFRERAEGGVAAIVTGGYPPVLEGNLTPFGQPFNSQEIADAHRQVTEATHAGGALAILQLLHAGRYGYHPMAVSASATQSPITPFPARELSDEEVRATIKAYGEAAKYAKDAGYDGVQIMGSEGYLINQFLAERTNQRTDGWGGSAEKRMRFPIEIVKAVRAAVPEDFLIDYRISVLDLVEGGQTQEEIHELARQLQDAGVDMFSSGIGWHEAQVPTIVTSVPRGAFAWATAELRKVVDVPVVIANRINTPQVAEQLLDGSFNPEGGEARTGGEPFGEFVSLARPMLADAGFVNRAAAGEAELINHCIACNQACLDHTFTNERATCLVNPRAGYETELKLLPTRTAKRVGVIGAGVAGLFGAEALAERGHRVEIFEASDNVGGQFQLAMRIPGKEEFVEALKNVQARLAKREVPIHLGSPRTPEELLEAGFDEVVVASGVTPRIPEFPGLAEALRGEVDGVSAMTYAELLSREKEAGKNVAVIGAGGIGYDVTEFLVEDRGGQPQSIREWNEHWGVTTDPEVRANLTRPNPPQPLRKVTMLQRKITRMGRGLGKTTGWVHRAAVAMAGVEQIVGVTYEKLDSEGLHITVPAQDIKELQKALAKAKKAKDTEELARLETAIREERKELVIPVDTVVLCTGQESVRPDKADGTSDDAEQKVHIVGGADVAAELDAKRAIRQAVELAARL